MKWSTNKYEPACPFQFDKHFLEQFRGNKCFAFALPRPLGRLYRGFLLVFLLICLNSYWWKLLRYLWTRLKVRRQFSPHSFGSKHNYATFICRDLPIREVGTYKFLPPRTKAIQCYICVNCWHRFYPLWHKKFGSGFSVDLSEFILVEWSTNKLLRYSMWSLFFPPMLIVHL